MVWRQCAIVHRSLCEESRVAANKVCMAFSRGGLPQPPIVLLYPALVIIYSGFRSNADEGEVSIMISLCHFTHLVLIQIYY